MAWKVYCGHCRRFLIESVPPILGSAELRCVICGALNQFDMANLQDQTYSLPRDHICDHPKCNPDLDISKGKDAYREIPLSKGNSDRLFALRPETCIAHR
jgi:LSD1 subclass zinc finger protein